MLETKVRPVLAILLILGLCGLFFTLGMICLIIVFLLVMVSSFRG